MDMDERYMARTAIENAFCDEARRPDTRNTEVAMAAAAVCGGLPFITAKEAKTGYPCNITVIFHWQDCQTSMRGFTLEMYERGEKWLNALKRI